MLKKIALLGAMALANGAVAQNANSILVLDGSGSMWGQIDGVAKITIAQDVVGDLMTSLPDDQALGLTVYGHRKKGDCSDIQTLVDPGLDTRASIVEAVNGIQPKGKTPMTDAVIMAAKALRYTEEEATVVLISDGIETCNADPCGAARALEEAGVKFTAHVVGFGVDDKDALAQMQCIADETGGQFVTAANASELSNALNEVVAAPEPEPILTSVTISARLDSEDGALITDPVLWSVEGYDGAIETTDNPLVVDLEAGSYDVSATWTAQEVEQVKQFIATGPAREVSLVFETPLPLASIIAPPTAVAGSMIEVAWTGPDGAEDYLGIGKVDARGANQWENYTYTQEGSPLNVLIPPTPGDYQIMYFQGGDRAPLASVPITVEPVAAGITAPATAVIGATVEVAWTGPNYEGDYVGIGKAGAKGANQWENYGYTSDGETLSLLMPPTPGDYLITYFLGQDREVLVSVPITLEPVTASITAPTTALVGETIEVAWTGPNYEGDYVGIGKAGAKGANQWENYGYTSDGETLNLLMPPTPGDYLITYFLGQDREVLVSVPITLEPVKASITAPTTALVGETIEVAWTGPNYEGDYVGIGKAGAKGANQWENYGYTSDGETLNLLMPPTPGDYLITYFLGQDREVLVSVPITLGAVETSIIAPDQAAAGSEIEIGWTGPNYADDYIGVGLKGAKGAAQWKAYAYTQNGNPATITLPDEAGEYVIQYFLSQDRTPMAARPLLIE